MEKTEHPEIKHLSDSELEIMQIIWDSNPPVSRSDIERQVCREKQLAPSTIITFLTRLCEKGFLSLKRQGRTNLYSPQITRQQYLASENRGFLNRLYGGSLSAFAVSLCDSGISKNDLEELRKLLEENNL